MGRVVAGHSSSVHMSAVNKFLRALWLSIFCFSDHFDINSWLCFHNLFLSYWAFSIYKLYKNTLFLIVHVIPDSVFHCFSLNY